MGRSEVAMDQWPSVTSDYIIARGEQGNPQLSVTLRLNKDVYLPAGDPEVARDLALTDLCKFETIYYQLTQPDVSVTLSSTMQQGVSASSPVAVLVQFVLEVINFLTPIAAGQPAPPPPSNASISQPVADENPGNLFALVVRVEILRNPDQTALRVEPAPLLSLQEFARQLENAFSSLKVLVAAPKKALGESAEEIWIARLAATPTGIAFEIDGQDPAFFAVAPLTRNLLSRRDVLVYPYQPGRYIANEIPIKISQSSVDLEQIGRDFLIAMEEVLGPQFSTETWKLEYSEALMAAKEVLATAISNHVVPVFATSDPHEGVPDAREQLRQQLLVKLTSAYTVDVIMQYPVAVTHSQYAADDPFAPRLFGRPVAQNPVDPKDIEKKNAFSFSTGSFSLAKRPTGTRVTFSFETNREQQGKQGNELDDVFTIALFHQINALEHEIHRVEGIEDYLASSWLTFVLPDSLETPGEQKLLVSLGEQTIPVPLRAYPTPPSLREHTFIPVEKQFVGNTELLGSEADLMLKTRLWKYRCQYEYVGAAHDKILASVKLNVPAGSPLQAKLNDADNPDLFAALLQFAFVYPDIAKDLDQYLPTGGNTQIAKNAIASFAWLAQRTANAWLTWQNDRALHQVALSESPAYHFVIEQRSEEINTVSALIVSVTADGVLRLPELPVVEISGYKTEVLTKTTEAATYYFVNEDNHQVLAYVEGRHLSTRSLVFNDFDILKVENAWAGAAVKRNEVLVPGKTTNPDFILQSPVVRFANVLTPLLDTNVEVDIAGFTTQRPASLAQFLSNFFIAFFAGAQTAGNENRTIRLNVTYSYELNSSGGDSTSQPGDSTSQPDLNITLPILLSSPTSISMLNKNLSPDSPFISSVSDTINGWISQNSPSGLQNSGRLWFDLSVYSSLSDSQLPVLGMRRLYLETRLLTT